MGLGRQALWVTVAGVWTYALGQLFSLYGLALLGLNALPVLSVSWPVVLTVAGMLIAFVLAFLCCRFLGAPSSIWIGALIGSLVVFVPQLQHALWVSRHSSDLLFVDSAPGGSVTETALALVGYPALTWVACRVGKGSSSLQA